VTFGSVVIVFIGVIIINDYVYDVRVRLKITSLICINIWTSHWNNVDYYLLAKSLIYTLLQNVGAVH